MLANEAMFALIKACQGLGPSQCDQKKSHNGL